MPAVVDFATLPQLQFALESRFPEQDQPVLSYKDTETKQWVDLNWNQLGHRIRSMAAFLHNQGVRTGDRVAILSENRPEWTITDMATQLIGAINVSLYNSLPSDQVAYILSDSGSKVLIASTGIQFKKAVDVFERCPALTRVVSMSPVKDLYNKWAVSWQSALDQGAEALPGLQDLIEATASGVRPGDVAALIYTSGTTGTPKGAIITHENFCSNAKAALELVPFSADDHHLSFLPLCHVFERTAGYTAVLAAGGRISYAESINTINRDLAELGPTVLITVPRLFERIYNLFWNRYLDDQPHSIDGAILRRKGASDLDQGPLAVIEAQVLCHLLRRDDRG